MRLGVPGQLPGSQAHRGEAPGLGGQVVRVGEVRLLAVHCEAPLDAAELAALAHLVAPDDGAVAIRIEGIAHARLLTDDQQVAAVTRRHQHRRRAEVEVGTVVVRTVRVAAVAVEDERVVGVNWFVQRIAPVSLSKAMIASLVLAAGSV